MKKLILFMAFIMLASFSFAQDEQAAPAPKPELFDMEVTIGVPMHWTGSPAPHKWGNLWGANDIDIDKTATASTSIGLAMNLNFTRTFGITLDTDFFIGTDLYGQSLTNSMANSLTGFNMFIGPVFFLYNGEFLRIPLAIGAHLYYWSSEFWAEDLSGGGAGGTWINYSDLQIGPSVSLGIQFHFNESIYLVSRTTVAVDLLRWHEINFDDGTDITTEKHTAEFTVGWHVKPTIGLGIKF